MKKNTNSWLNCFFLLIPFFLLACEQRDPEAEFQKLVDTPYTNIKEGIKALDDYIDHFKGKATQHIEEAYKMRSQYSAMDELFSGSFRDYAHFMEVVDQTKEKGEDSQFASVREVWRQLFVKKKHSLLDPGLEKLDKNSFVDYMTENAKELCKDGTILLKSDVCDIVEMGEPQLTEDGFSKTCEGTFRVHLKDPLVGLLQSTALIKLKGEIVGDCVPSFQYRLAGYEILEAPTQLRDVITTAAQLLLY